MDIDEAVAELRDCNDNDKTPEPDAIRTVLDRLAELEDGEVTHEWQYAVRLGEGVQPFESRAHACIAREERYGGQGDIVRRPVGPWTAVPS